jgi:hypothetical protein
VEMPGLRDRQDEFPAVCREGGGVGASLSIDVAAKPI